MTAKAIKIANMRPPEINKRILADNPTVAKKPSNKKSRNSKLNLISEFEKK